MSSLPKTYLTPEEYLAFERQCEHKNEYFKGEIFAMTGASRQHNLITGNIASELGQQLKQRVDELYIGRMRVLIPLTTSYMYPDVVVVCDEPQFADGYLDTLTNPTLIVEVLSASTELYDRGKKFEQYRKLDSLKEYLLVAQDKLSVERYLRQPDGGWLMSEFNKPEEMLKLTSIECNLALEEIYSKVAFDV
ncbi:MAG TPA: Uma2 family endonuclease [Pyrinomonadaceae bacterium]|jgi:Uma2 family endonuclease|nr:Uma2 family endonuclease [Pyrinomonadaceae bacterium]